MAFKPATKEQSKLRLAIMGPSGSGKTFSSLQLGRGLGVKIAVIDSERGSASKYADLFQFDVCDLENHAPQTYVKAIKEAEAAGYDVLVIDSLSHAWSGKDGALEQVDKAAKRSQSGNSFAAWREVTPHHNALVDAILQSKCHVIATMRTKTEYTLEENEKGKKVPKKIGMAPVQRDGVEYEFDVVADMNLEHDLIVTKTRCHLIDGLIVNKPGNELAATLKGWLDGGTAPAPKSGGQKNDAKSAESSTSTDAGTPPGGEEKKSPSQPNSPAQTAGTQTPSASGTSNAGGSAAKTETATKSTESASTANQSSPSPSTSKVNKEQMNQLLASGEANGWKRVDLSKFVCFAFGHTPQTLAQNLTEKQWEQAVKMVSHPANKGGKVSVSASGKQLPPERCFPQG